MVSKKKVLAIAAAGGAAIVAVVALGQVKAAPGTVSFAITAKNSNTVQPIPGASITYAGVTQVANASGTASFVNVPLGPQLLSASASGYQDYGPTSFTPSSGLNYFVPLIPLGGGIPYAQSLTFASASVSATGATVMFFDQNTISIQAVAWCVVKNSALQAVSLGSSALQSISPNQSKPFQIPLSPALSPGTYAFTFFAVDANGQPVSDSTTVTRSV